MTQTLSAPELATPRHAGPQRQTGGSDLNIPVGREYSEPTLAEGLVMLAGLYRDLLELAVWRRVGTRLPQEAHELNATADR